MAFKAAYVFSLCLDISSGFDTVSHSCFLDSLRLKNIVGWLIRRIKVAFNNWLTIINYI